MVASKLAGSRRQDGGGVSAPRPQVQTAGHREGRQEGGVERGAGPQGADGACWPWGGQMPRESQLWGSLCPALVQPSALLTRAQSRRPRPTPHGGLSRSLSRAWVAPHRGCGGGGAGPVHAALRRDRAVPRPVAGQGTERQRPFRVRPPGPGSAGGSPPHSPPLCSFSISPVPVSCTPTVPLMSRCFLFCDLLW